MLCGCAPQPAEQEMGCNLRELLCFGSCGLGKTLEYLICKQQFPGLRISGWERLGFILVEPLEVLEQDLCCLFAVFFPKGIKLTAIKAFALLPADAFCRDCLLSAIPHASFALGVHLSSLGWGKGALGVSDGILIFPKDS